MTDIIIHGSPFSTYTRTARMAAEEKGVSYDLQDVEFGSDALKALHPFAKIPVMCHGDATIYETAAIVSYIDGVFDGPSLKPDNAGDEARMWQWVSAINDYIDQTMIRDYVLSYVIPQMSGKAPDQDKISATLPDVKRQLGIIDDALANSKHLAGDQMSFADLFLAPILFYVSQMPEGSDLLGPCANIQRGGAEMTQRASYLNTMPPMPKAAK
jgi:glutathione S-transferase